MINNTNELVAAVAKAICLKLDADPTGATHDPRSGGTIPNWKKYTGAASAAIEVILEV